MNEKIAVFKIGGKILEELDDLRSTISQLEQLYSENLINKIILIPGGGSFANFIRKIYSELKFTEEIAHWMGIISMNYNGLELSKKFPNLQITESYEQIKEKKSTLCIFLPYEFIKENDKLPHSWDVTSDSIALFIAKELELNECFLIKDVDGILNKENQVIKEISTSKFKDMRDSGDLAESLSKNESLKLKTTPIDPYTTSLIDKYNISCIILNGTRSSPRILNYFQSTKLEDKIYTKII
ncbi:MAG: hypothetical protein ACFFAB_08165 [Candidatus Heimdallarchaeota archaeon]